MPQTFAAAPLAKGDGRGVDPARWWRALHDGELNSLIERAMAASPTLEIALDRLQQARAQEAVLIGAALPSLEASAGGGWGTGSDLARGRASPPLVSAETGVGVSQVTNIVGFDAGWEIDVFGKFRRAIEAAGYDVQAAIAARNMVLVSVIADVTRAYLDLRALQMQLAVVRKNVQVAEHYMNFVQERFDRGITNELDVTLARRELARLQAQVAPLAARIDAARYVIAALIGEFPENLGKELARPGTLPALPGRIRPGLPIDLLRRRPDIQAAERQLAAATARIGAAASDLYPKFSLTGDAGLQSISAGDWFAAGSRFWTAGPTVQWRIFDAGRVRAAVQAQSARADQALAAYEQSMLAAFTDVETALTGYAQEQTRRQSLAHSAQASGQVVSMARDLYSHGLADFLRVLEAQRTLYQSQDALIESDRAVSLDLIALYKALGGGWEEKSQPAN